MMESIEAAFDSRLLLAAMVVAGAGFMRGFIGFGAALMSVPVLAWAYGPLAAIALSTVISVASTLVLLPTAIRLCERPVVVPIGVGCVCRGANRYLGVGQCGPDADAHDYLTARGEHGCLFWRGGWELARHVHRGILVSAGLIGGFVQGVAGIGGPPVVAVALSRKGPAQLQRAKRYRRDDRGWFSPPFHPWPGMGFLLWKCSS